MFGALMCSDHSTERLIGGLSLAGIVILSVILLFVIGKNRRNNTKVLAYGAICTALSFGLSFIKIPISFLGGSITLASMVPIIIFAYCFGVGRGLLVGLIYGLLQFIQSPQFYNVIQFLFDYLIAFSALGLGGIFFKVKSVRVSLILGALVACLARFASATIAGIVWFYAYGPYESLAIFGSTAGMGAFVYSLLYNALYMIPETIITVGVIATLTVSKQLLHVLPSDDPLGKKYVFESADEGDAMNAMVPTGSVTETDVEKSTESENTESIADSAETTVPTDEKSE